MQKLLPLVPIVLLAVSQILMKREAIGASSRSADSWGYLKALAMSPGMWIALSVAGTAFVAWMLILQRFPLSQVYPAISLTFPLVAMLAWLILGERIGLMQALGLVLIVMGVAMSTRYGVDGT